MIDMMDITMSVSLLFGLGGWVLYFREHGRSRDYATDLLQLVHDCEDAQQSLRRSLKWDEIRQRVNRVDP